ncbi:MAG: hypothetical protein MJA83_10195 [Gammaproteobacteria bacterium]|nr:hypothetical protein [Gammaproteobacteria bacterium]
MTDKQELLQKQVAELMRNEENRLLFEKFADDANLTLDIHWNSPHPNPYIDEQTKYSYEVWCVARCHPFNTRTPDLRELVKEWRAYADKIDDGSFITLCAAKAKAFRNCADQLEARIGEK